MGLVLRPADQPPGVAAVGEDLLDEGKGSSGSLQDAAGAVTVLDIGGMDLDRQQTAIGVGQDVALASVNALSRIIALASPFWSAVRTVWLSSTVALGEGSRPDRSRSSSSRAWWIRAQTPSRSQRRR